MSMTPIEPVVRRGILAAIVVLVAYLLWKVMAPLLEPLVWACILAILFYPLHRWLLGKLRRPALAATLTTAVVTLTLLGPLVWLVSMFVQQALDLASAARQMDVSALTRQWIVPVLDRFPAVKESLLGRLDGLIQTPVALVAQWSGKLAAGIGSLAFRFFFALFALFFLLRDAASIRAFLVALSPFGGEASHRILEEITVLIQITIRASLLVAVAQGGLTGLLLAASGVPSPIFWGVVATILAAMPVVGPALVYLPAAAYLALTGRLAAGLLVAVGGLVVVSSMDNVLRPLLISGQSQMNSLLILVGILGGVSAFGLLGFVLGPLIIAVALGMLRGLRDILDAAQGRPAPPISAP